MKTLSIYAAFGKTHLVDQHQNLTTQTTNLDLCRSIIDELIDRDLMGFLLSSAHLRKFLAHYTTYGPATLAQMVHRIILNSDVVDQIHLQLLVTFKGLHIAESSITSHSKLMRHLDSKYEVFAQEVGTGDVRYEVSLLEAKGIENERRYRQACEVARTTTR